MDGLKILKKDEYEVYESYIITSVDEQNKLVNDDVKGI